MDIHKFISENRYGYDVVTGLDRLYEYYPFESDIINNIDVHRCSIIKKSRQMHLTTLYSMYATWYLISNTSSLNQIYYVTHSSRISKFIKDDIIKNIFRLGLNIVASSNDTIVLSNGNMIILTNNLNQLVYKSIKNSKSENINNVGLIIIDEAAYNKDFNRHTFTLSPILLGVDKNCRISIGSSPNEINNFSNLYLDSISGKTLFSPISVNYTDNPRFNNPEWYGSISRSLNYDNDMIKQEVFGEFIQGRPKLKTKKYRQIQCRIDDNLLDSINRKVLDSDISISDYIRLLIEKDITS